MSRPLRVGLTGGIGSGKSTVRDYFDELGAPTIDADEISHRVARPGEAAFNDIVALFGESCLDAAGRLRRRYLRERVFADAALKKQLEDIIHPRVRAEIRDFVDRTDGAYCIICIPLLLETGAQKSLDRVLVVDAPEELQSARVRRRDGASAQQAADIMKSQMGRAERLRAADDVIVNDGDLESLRAQVVRLHERYRGAAPGDS